MSAIGSPIGLIGLTVALAVGLAVGVSTGHEVMGAASAVFSFFLFILSVCLGERHFIARNKSSAGHAESAETLGLCGGERNATQMQAEMSIYTDNATGLQYLGSSRGGLTPRLDHNGKQMKNAE
ncbi:MAG: DUF6440 family protein [Rhodospirillaceae bacterium]